MIGTNEKTEGLSELDLAAREEFFEGVKHIQPGITEDEIERAFAAWWLEPRPPDAPGRPITKERFKRIFGKDATAEEHKRLKLR